MTLIGDKKKKQFLCVSVWYQNNYLSKLHDLCWEFNSKESSSNLASTQLCHMTLRGKKKKGRKKKRRKEEWLNLCLIPASRQWYRVNLMCAELFLMQPYCIQVCIHRLLEAARRREDIKVYLHPREHAHLSATRPFVQVWKTFYSLKIDGEAENNCRLH